MPALARSLDYILTFISTYYAYDSLNRLTSEINTRPGGYTNTFQYDAADNPTLFRGVDPTGGAGYNPDNQNANSLYSYDGEGNPLSYMSISGQTFNAEDRPTSIPTTAGATLSNGWRVDGLRGWKQGSSGQINYLYAGGVPVCEINGSGGVAAVNTWGPAGLLARQSGGVNTYYAWDALGNVAQTLSSGGSVTNTFSWDAYGKGVSTSGSSDPYAGFGGEWGYYTDHETGLTLCGARFYDSNAGRWVTRDPAGYGGGINLYAYCGNNPLSFIDPFGLWSLYKWIYTGDGDASDENYQAALDQGADTLNRWWCHFKDRNRREWPGVAGAAAAGTIPYWSLPKPGQWIRSGASPWTSVSRMASLPAGRGGWLPPSVATQPWFNNNIRKPILVRMAQEVRQDYKTLGPVAPLKGALAGAALAEAVLAWQATFDTLGDDLGYDSD